MRHQKNQPDHTLVTLSWFSIHANKINDKHPSRSMGIVENIMFTKAQMDEWQETLV
jgi:hypothetical protein